MKLLKTIGLIVLLTVAAILVYALLLPTEGGLERTITINTPPSVIYKELTTIKTFNKWSPWLTIDPDAEYTYEGPEQGTGAKMIWVSEHPDVGNGSQEIIKTSDNELITMKLDFGYPGDYYADFILKRQDNATKVTWTYRYENIDFITALFIEILNATEMVGASYENGLNQLKTYIETNSASSFGN